MNNETSFATQWWLSACIKCGGALFLCQDNYGQYRKCINCGKQHQQQTPEQKAAPSAKPERAKPAAAAA